MLCNPTGSAYNTSLLTIICGIGSRCNPVLTPLSMLHTEYNCETSPDLEPFISGYLGETRETLKVFLIGWDS